MICARRSNTGCPVSLRQFRTQDGIVAPMLELSLPRRAVTLQRLEFSGAARVSASTHHGGSHWAQCQTPRSASVCAELLRTHPGVSEHP